MAQELKKSELPIDEGRVYHMGLAKDMLAPNVFLVGDPERANKVANHFDSVRYRVTNREFNTITGTYKGMPVTVSGIGIGTDNTEISMVELYILNNLNLNTGEVNPDATPLTVIRLGTSGGLQKDIKLGTLAISNYGLGLDNTGLFYNTSMVDGLVPAIEVAAYKLITEATPPGKRFRKAIFPYASRATPEVVEALEHQAEKDNLDFISGITVSGSGFYGNQGRQIPGLNITAPNLQEHLSALNVEGQIPVNFEMESSILFHLATQMGYRCGTICPVVANRLTGEFLTDYSQPVEDCIMVGLEAMLSLQNSV